MILGKGSSFSWVAAQALQLAVGSLTCTLKATKDLFKIMIVFLPLNAIVILLCLYITKVV